jgi:uroporphyrinogen decarboxylase
MKCNEMRDSGPNFERLKKALFNQGEPDRVPFFDLTVEKGVRKAFMNSIGRPSGGLRAVIDFWTQAGYDFICVGGRYGWEPVTRSLVYSASAHHSSERDEEIQMAWADQKKGTITSDMEFEEYNWPGIGNLDYSFLNTVEDLLPAGMKAITHTVGPFLSIYMLMGAETLFHSIYKNPELVAKLYKKVNEILLQQAKDLLAIPSVGALVYADDIAYKDGLLVSPKHLRTYDFPVLEQVCELCRKAGKPLIFHSDGKLYEVMDDLIACGVNALNPIEPPCMDINYVKQKWGDKLCLIGNISVSSTLALGTPKDVEDEVKQRIRDTAPGGGYCCGSSPEVTEWVPVENYIAMRDAVIKYGKYPIKA